jgi:hypothetical protein
MYSPTDTSGISIGGNGDFTIISSDIINQIALWLEVRYLLCEYGDTDN